MTSDALLLEAARSLVVTAGSAESASELESAVRAFFPRTQLASDAERAEVLATLAPALRLADEERAVLVGFLCGALVESGAPSEAVAPSLLECYARIIKKARTELEHGKPNGSYALLERSPA